MNNLFEAIPSHFNPWKFAQEQRQLDLSLPLEKSQELVGIYGKNGQINAQLRGFVDSQGYSHLAGSISTELPEHCQRCLESMNLAISQNFDYVLIRHGGQEEAVEAEGKESFICPEDELDLAWFLEEEVLLAIPMIVKHQQCEAPHYEREEFVHEEKPNPFAVLKNLKL